MPANNPLPFAEGQRPPEPSSAAFPRPGRTRRTLLPKPASRGSGRAHRLFHPLCGATLPTLVRLLLQGGVAPQRAHVAAIALAMGVLRLPFTLAEAGFAAAGRHPPIEAPIFIVGHWRSGTTHLANLLSRSPEFAILSPMDVGLPAEALGLARLARPFVEQFFPRTRLIDEIALSADLPQENELALANLSTLSCNHGLYFPGRLREEFARGLFGDGVGAGELARWSRSLRRYVNKMARMAGGRRLLIRNPASSTRIPLLRALWPEAQFIHIHRDPAAVIASSTRMTTTLIRELSLGRPEADAASLVREVYPRLMLALMRDGDALPAPARVEIRHDVLCRQPLEALQQIHQALALPGFEAARPRFAEYLGRVRGHVPRPYRVAPADAAWMRTDCAAIFGRFGYRLPEAHATRC